MSLTFPRFNHAGVMRYKNGQTANYGSIRVENDRFYHYTGKGLREMFKSNMNSDEQKLAQELRKKSEAELIESEHIMCPLTSEIEEILS